VQTTGDDPQSSSSSNTHPTTTGGSLNKILPCHTFPPHFAFDPKHTPTKLLSLLSFSFQYIVRLISMPKKGIAMICWRNIYGFYFGRQR
jgi:hypothetical protein